MSNTRSINMQKRRERILAEARAVLADQGFDALNLRDLAEVSDLTVPTIYNLIGNKEQILEALVMGAFGDFEEQLEKSLPCPPGDLPELMADTLEGLISRDEEFYRASALANERLESLSTEAAGIGFRRITISTYFRRLCRTQLEDGLLKGEISQELLVEQMVAVHQVTFRDWAHRVLSLREFRKHSIQGFYVTLAADATDSYRASIVKALGLL